MVTTQNHIAVIDGSTSKTTARIDPDISNGRLAMLLLSDMIADLPSQITCEGCCKVLTEGIQEFLDFKQADISMLLAHPNMRPTACAAVYSVFHQQVWLIGDCQCLIDGAFYDNPKPMEDTNALKRSMFIHEALASGRQIREFQEHDDGRDIIVNDIIRSCEMQNKSFAVIDGTPIPQKYVQMIPCQGAHEIVLSTDGYPFLKPTLEESEDALRHLLKNDPLCISEFLATKGLMSGYKSFDDRTYIRFSPF